ncbi:unnamed protein product, partial [Toxocara canis]|uniref:Uncharacterized protein n=1 Tax=Toxocara canis TaxID=6265 RepID=A0A183TYV9_TOXCA
MTDHRRHDALHEAKRKREMLCEDVTVEVATVDSNDAVRRSDELSKQDSAGNQLPAESLPKEKKEGVKGEVKLETKIPNANESEEKTHFEQVNVVVRPAVSKGKRKSSLRWKNECHNRQLTEPTTHEETVTKDEREAQHDCGAANERTKFEMVAVESRPTVSKHRRKNLKWKDSDKEVRRNANGGTVEDSNNTQATADSDADKLVTQEEAGN